jgi:hypothetical protein
MIPVDAVAPRKTDIPKITESGLAKIDMDGGIIFSKDWDHNRVVEALHVYLPEVFGYFDSLPPADIPHWVLCWRQNRSLMVVTDREVESPNSV